MSKKNTPQAPTTRAHQPVAAGADDKALGRTEATLRKILAGQRAKQTSGAGLADREDADLRRDSEPGDREAEWARHVEWTLRLMS